MNFSSEVRAAPSLRFNENLQYIRAFAALSVMLFHAAHYIHAYLGPGLYDIFHNFLGLYGVAIFFALSGYLMVELSQRQNAHIFLASRIIRIYPALFLATAFALLSAPVRISEHFQWISLTLVPGGDIFYALNVEWTLVHEIFFYVLLFTIIYIKIERILPLFGLLWITIIVLRYGTAMPKIGHADITQIFFMTANVGFATGLIIPFILRCIPRIPFLLVAFFFASIPITFFVPVYFARITSGIGSAALITAALQTSEPIFKGATSRVMRSLGDWSYAMYLIHVPVILFLVRHIPTLGWPEFSYIVCVFGAILASIALGKADITIHQYTRKMMQNTPPMVLTQRINAFVIAYLFLSVVWLT